MQLRPHESDPKLTVATYDNRDQAEDVALETAPVLKKYLYTYGLIKRSRIREISDFTVLDDGQVEVTHDTKRLVRYAGYLARQSAELLSSEPEEVSSYAKSDQTLADTVNQYLTQRTLAIPTRPPYVKPEPTSSEKARYEAFSQRGLKNRKLFAASVLGLTAGIITGVSGRFVEAFSVNPNTPNHINEAVRQIGNDMSFAGLAVGGLSIIVGWDIIMRHGREETGFYAGWQAANNRLDPDGQIEASIQQLPEAQERTQ